MLVRLTKCKSRKFLFIFFAVLFLMNPAYAVIENEEMSEEEKAAEKDAIHLQIEQNDIQNVIDEKQEKKHLTLKNFGQPDGSAWDLVRSSGYTFKKGPIKNQKFRHFVHAANVFTVRRGDDLSNTTQFIANETQSETLFADNKTKLMVGFNFSRNTKYENEFLEKISFLFLEHKFNENQTIEIGENRIPIGYEGGIGSSAIKLVARSQIARTHGNYVSTGIRNKGNYKYVTYDIGVYDASRFFHNNFDGYEFAGIVGFKPLAKYDGKYGDLRIGGSYDVGNSDNSFSVVGAHAIYKYKNLYADFEYMYANGSSGLYYGQGRSHGLYTTVGYFIHPKVEVLGRYDFYQNLENDNVSQEYTTGVTYYLNPRTKLMLNYVLAMKDTSSIPTHKVYLGVDFVTSSLLDLL